jgi:hypothetical protein
MATRRERKVFNWASLNADYFENFYNPQRRHSSLNYLTPDEFEELQLTQTETALSQTESAFWGQDQAVQQMGSRTSSGGTGIRTPGPLHAIGLRIVHVSSNSSKVNTSAGLSVHVGSSRFT